MARIAEEEIERLKREADLAQLVRRSGVELRPAGADLVGCCPFHDDATPSLVITPRKGLWHCMGACQAGGSVIDWVMRAEGVSFRHAVELLRAGASLRTNLGGARRPAASTVPRLPSPVSATAADDELLGEVVDYYRRTLAGSPEALSYLARRRIDDPAVIERFRLGYSNRTLGLRLPKRNRLAGAELRSRLVAIGVYRPSGHEHLVGSVTIPITTPEGRVVGLYGRKVRDDLRAGTPSHLYLPGPHRGVWNEEALATSSEIILTESLVDALSFYCAGFTNVTAAYGTSGFTTDQREAFSRHGVARVLVAYDHDAAGDAAAGALATELSGLGMECFRVTCPYGADVNDVAVGAKNPRHALGRLVREAQWMSGGRRRGAGPAEESPAPAPASERTSSPPAAESPLVSPVPAPPAAPADAARHDELVLEAGGRLWRVRHIPSGPSPGSLKVNLMVRAGERFHLDVIDLYAARQRQGFVTAAAAELRGEEEQLRSELGRVLLATEEAQAAAEAGRTTPATPPMRAAEREAALELLSDPSLTTRVTEAFSTLGLVGESDAALVAWLVLVSRLAERPLGAVIQSSSAAGKSTLVETALSLVAPEQTVAFSAMTGQALYYLGESDLAHKVLSIAETEGAERASYALKLLVSEGRFSIAAAGKDPVSGRLVTNTYEVAGPVALLMTTTAAELEAELANRLVVLAIDEGRAQTRAVQAAQRHSETLQGLLARACRADTVALHQNAQRLLEPVAVVNPHAVELSFPDQATRHRRDHAKYLGLIRAIAIAHQRQRPRHQIEVGARTVAYIEAAPSDVELARRLAGKVLETTTDEMAPSTRRLLGEITARLAGKGERRFSRRELRETTGLSDAQLKVHLARLVDLEHVVCHRAGPRTTYELVEPVTQPYDADRPVTGGDGLARGGDRLVIGRFPGTVEKVQPNRENGSYQLGSADTGRSSSSAAASAPSRENGAHPAHRPLSRRTRVNGAVPGAAVEGGR